MVALLPFASTSEELTPSGRDGRGGVERPGNVLDPREEVLHDNESSDRRRSGRAPRSTIGMAAPWNCGLLNGTEKVAIVPWSSFDCSEMEPCMRSTS